MQHRVNNFQERGGEVQQKIRIMKPLTNEFQTVNTNIFLCISSTRWPYSMNDHKSKLYWLTF